MTDSLFFSIVIPTLNEQKYVPMLLKDLKKQTFKDFEVIVVDGSSDDQTVPACHQVAGRLQLRTQVVKRRNVSFQRNHGAKTAKGSWVLFMDADNRLPPYFLQGLKYQLEKNPVTDVFTCWIDPAAYDMQDQVLIQLSNVGMELYSKIKPVAPGALIGCRKTVLNSVKFDENLKVSEDHAFVLEAVHQGYQFRIFREPRFIYSFRRFKSEGTLKTLRIYAQLNLQYLLGTDVIGGRPQYPMNGGASYQLEPSSQKTWVGQMQQQLSNLTKAQKQRLLKLWQSLDIPLNL